MNEKEIGELFREKLSDWQSPPPADGWKKIAKSVAANKAETAVRSRWIAGIVAVVVTGAILIVAFSHFSKNEGPVSADSQDIDNHNTIVAVPSTLAPVVRVKTPKLSDPAPVADDYQLTTAPDSEIKKTVPVQSPIVSLSPDEIIHRPILPKTSSASIPVMEVVDFPHLAGNQSALSQPVQPITKSGALHHSGDTSVCKNSLLTLFVENAMSVRWSTGTQGQTLSIYPEEPMTLFAEVQLTDKNDTVIYFQINVFDCELFIPSAFTPNGDGLNDEFLVSAPFEISQYDCVIFDKASRVLFQTKSIQHGWDGTLNGKPLPAGGYFYVIKYRDQMNKPHVQKGQVVLVR